MEWPPDFYAQLAGETCPLCAQGRPEETPHGLRYLAGEAADAYLWTDERWRLLSTHEPTGLPVIVLLEPRAHHASPADLPVELAREQGVMLGRVERAVLSVGGIGKVHIGRWGEGAEHLHWWFIGRPEGQGQLRSSFAEIWDEVLPPTPREVWEDNLARVVRALRDG